MELNGSAARSEAQGDEVGDGTDPEGTQAQASPGHRLSV